MIGLRVGDIVSVEFPFSDLQTHKRRPGLVLVSGNLDLLVARVTTHPPREPSDISLKYWAESGLPRASTVRLTKIATIDNRLVHHRIGRLHADDARNVAQAWQQIVAMFATESLK